VIPAAGSAGVHLDRQSPVGPPVPQEPLFGKDAASAAGHVHPITNQQSQITKAIKHRTSKITNPASHQSNRTSKIENQK
jgi:hypothetical protein